MGENATTITLPLAEQHARSLAVLLAFAVLTYVIYRVLSAMDGKPRTHALARLGTGWVAVLLPLGLVWLALFLLVLGAAFWGTWRLYEDTGAGTLGLGALLVALLGAPFLVWSTVIKHQTLRYQKEGHITDRISKAVEQLGAEKTVKKDGREETVPNIEVRIGAILSLERIAQDSTAHDTGRDHVRVMEIMCAYVRENSNARPPRDFPLPEWEPLREGATAEERSDHEQWRQARFGRRVLDSNAWEWARSLPKPRADVQIALDVIGRRTLEQRLVEAAWPDVPEPGITWPFDTPCPELRKGTDDEPLTGADIDDFQLELMAWGRTLSDCSGYRLDLRGANLQGADLSAKRPDASDAVFSGALLGQARMEGADLCGTRMVGVNLHGARMDGVNLNEARMEGAYLRKAQIEGANLSKARLVGADVSKARMEGSDLWKVWLLAATLHDTVMEKTRLKRVWMVGAELCRARLQQVNLTGARLESADLWRALIVEAEMDQETIMTSARLQQSGLRNVDLSDVPITDNQIASAFGDASVTLPEGMPRPAHWPVWELPDDGPHAFHTEYRRWLADPAAYTPPPPPERG